MDQADNVIGFVVKHYGNYPIIYADIGLCWDLLEHDGKTFTGFRSLGNVTDIMEAVGNLNPRQEKFYPDFEEKMKIGTLPLSNTLFNTHNLII